MYGDSVEARASKIALSISSGAYTRWAIHELDQRYRKESVIAPKISSSGNAEHCDTPPDMEQLRGLTKSSGLVRNVRSGSCWTVGGVAQWLASLSMRSCEFRDLALG